MPGTYHGITEGTNGLPIISKTVVFNGMVYLCGITASKGGSIQEQTREVLSRIDHLLIGAGSDKGKVLTAQVWLTSMADFAAMNTIWNEWVDPEHPPVRACVQAALYQPELLVEIMVTATT